MTPSENTGGGPHVQAAFLCERVMQEVDSVLSFIRVVDKFTRPRPSQQIPPQPVQVTLVTALKGGAVPTGNYKIKSRLYKPDATVPLIEAENDAFFPGLPEAGVTIETPLLFLADEEGLYWVDVMFMEQLITRVPFRVIFATVQTTPIQQRPGS
jgi:hypothetical protein